MKSKFEMSDLGILNYLLSLEFMHTNKEIFLSQKSYICEILKIFKMENCNTFPTLVVANMKLIKNWIRKL